MLLQELFALTVSEAEKDHIHFVKGHLSSETEVCLANESFMHFADGIARIALAIGKNNLCLRMS